MRLRLAFKITRGFLLYILKLERDTDFNFGSFLLFQERQCSSSVNVWGTLAIGCAQYLPLRFTLSPEYQHFLLSRWVVNITLDCISLIYRATSLAELHTRAVSYFKFV